MTASVKIYHRSLGMFKEESAASSVMRTSPRNYFRISLTPPSQLALQINWDNENETGEICLPVLQRKAAVFTSLQILWLKVIVQDSDFQLFVPYILSVTRSKNPTMTESKRHFFQEEHLHIYRLSIIIFTIYGGKQGIRENSCLNYYCCFSLVVKSCPPLRDPMNQSTPGAPIFHCLPELGQIHVCLLYTSPSPRD